MTSETETRPVPAEPTTPIKASEAIRLGCLIAPVQGRILAFGSDGRACAIGAMALGLGYGRDSDATLLAIKQLGGHKAHCPAGPHPQDDYYDQPVETYTAVWHLNDAHQWPRERIADWLAEQGL